MSLLYDIGLWASITISIIVPIGILTLLLTFVLNRENDSDNGNLRVYSVSRVMASPKENYSMCVKVGIPLILLLLCSMYFRIHQLVLIIQQNNPTTKELAGIVLLIFSGSFGVISFIMTTIYDTINHLKIHIASACSLFLLVQIYEIAHAVITMQIRYNESRDMREDSLICDIKDFCIIYGDVVYYFLMGIGSFVSTWIYVIWFGICIKEHGPKKCEEFKEHMNNVWEWLSVFSLIGYFMMQSFSLYRDSFSV